MVSKPMECFLYPRRLSCGLAAALLLALAQGASAAICTWDGGGANELASNRTYWSGDIAPVAGDHIVLNTTSHKSMTWNMTNMTVASWTQDGYNGTVTVATVYGPAGFTNLNITGNCIISNGMWTHSGPQNPETYRLRATIGGDLIIGPAGAKRYQARAIRPGAALANGPATALPATAGAAGPATGAMARQ